MNKDILREVTVKVNVKGLTDAMNRLTSDPVVKAVAAILGEREYQDQKWGGIVARPHSVPEWILIMEEELEEAKKAWRDADGIGDSLHEVRQVAAVALACLEQHGAPLRREEKA